MAHCKKAKSLTEHLQSLEQNHQLTLQGLEPVALMKVTLDLINTTERCAEHAVYIKSFSFSLSSKPYMVA